MTNSGLLGGLGAACYRRRWLTVLAWIAGLACLVTLWARFGAAAQNGFTGNDPGQALLGEHFAARSGDTLMLAIMRAGGLPDRRAVGGLYLLWVIVNGFSLEETRTGDPERSGPDLSSEVTRYFASLPGDRFPNLVAAAGEFAKTDWDERFELLIRTFIDGLAA